MLKVERIQNLLKCVICNNLLDKPIYLPCGEIICQKHLDNMNLEILNDSKILIHCGLCNENHVDNFYIVKSIQNLLKLELDEIYCPSFTECKQTLSELELEINKSEEILSNSDSYIEENFERIKTEIKLHQSTLITNIDIYCVEMFKKIDNTKIECESMLDIFEQRSTKLQETKLELKKFLTEFDSPKIEDAKYKELNSKAKKLKLRLNEDFNYDLLGGCFYKFEPVVEKVEDLFGRFKIIKVNFENMLHFISFLFVFF